MTAPLLCIVPPPMQGPRRDPYTADKLVERLVSELGIVRVRRLVRDFEHAVPTKTIARKLGANPRRVEEWRDMLGSTITCYVVHEDVRVLADEQTE